MRSFNKAILPWFFFTTALATISYLAFFVRESSIEEPFDKQNHDSKGKKIHGDSVLGASPSHQSAMNQSLGESSDFQQAENRKSLPPRISRPRIAFDAPRRGRKHPGRRDASSVDRIKGLFSVKSVSQRKGTSEIVSELKGMNGLNDRELNSAYEALSLGNKNETLSEESWNWVVDEIMGAMRNEGSNPHLASLRLSELFSDRSIPTTTRDYALQHLGHLFNENRGDTVAIRGSMIEALSEKEATIAGTALLALSHNFDGQLLQTLNKPALHIAKNEGYSLESRATALQVAFRNGETGVKAYSESILSVPSTPAFLKRSADAVVSSLNELPDN